MQNKQKNPTSTRVAIYIRVSTTHQIDRDSLPMQRQDLLTYAKLMLNTDDCVIFEDAGYSGKNMDRPKFQEMMSQIRAGLFTHLLVWKLDRISRNLLDFASMYAELKNLGVTFISKNEQFDTSTAMGEAMLKIILVFAELERNMTSERVTATMISRANNGQWNGGRVPYGYNWDKETKQFSLNENEAEVVVLIHDKYEEMRSLIFLSRWLNQHGYSTRYGNLWNPVSLRIILRNVFYCGDYRYNVLKEGDRQQPKDSSEWITIPNHHRTLISKEQKDRVIKILESNVRTPKNRGIQPKSIHVFAGLIRCGNCGKIMGASSQNKNHAIKYSTYRCSSGRRTTTKCSGTSDMTVGEFTFNYILNMLNAQKDFQNIKSPEALQKRLLVGNTFDYIDNIEEDGLEDLFHVLSSGTIQTAIYGKGSNIKPPKISVKSELSKLRKEKERLNRALDRLTHIFLYSEDAMSDLEFITRKTDITEKLDEIDEKIGCVNQVNEDESVSDELFIQRASEFIIAQKLDNRNYINYKNLASSVDQEVLYSFVHSIIDHIVVESRKVKQIVFKNGLSHTFVYQNE